MIYCLFLVNNDNNHNSIFSPNRSALVESLAVLLEGVWCCKHNTVHPQGTGGPRYLHVGAVRGHEFLVDVGACFAHAALWGVHTAPAADLKPPEHNSSSVGGSPSSPGEGGGGEV